MKSKARKLSAVLLALVMTLMMSVSAFAASTGTGKAVAATSTSTATLTVATGNNGDTLYAYKVVNAALDDATNNLEYSFTDTFKAFLASEKGAAYTSLTPDSYCEYENDSAELKGILGAFTAYMKSLDTMPAADYTSTTVTNGSATFTKVAMGQYVIIGGGNTKGALIYQSVTAEVVPFVENGVYKIYPAYSVEMKTSEPTTDKEITTGTVKDSEKDTASIGDTIGFRLNATVPTYPAGATNKTYYIADTLSNGLTLATEANDFVVKGYTDDADTTGTALTIGTDYTIEIKGQQIYIDFAYDNIKPYAKVSVEYSALLNENALIGGNGNVNTMDLVYSNAPFDGNTYVPGNDRPDDKPGYGKKTDEEIVYTYTLAINKFEKDNETVKLANAKFAIYDNESCTGDAIATITTDANGYAAYVGLKAGTYYFKETVAPSGYKLLVNPVEVVLTEANATQGVTTTKTIEYTSVKADSLYGVQATDETGNKLWLASGETQTPTTEYAEGYLPAYVLSVTSAVESVDLEGTAATGSIVVDIENTKGGILPSTGGMGTTLFIVIGSVLMIGAVIALVVKKRMSFEK